MTFEHKKGDLYAVTGVTVDGKRFKMTYEVPEFALAINLWRGSVWQVRDGVRKLLKRVMN